MKHKREELSPSLSKPTLDAAYNTRDADYDRDAYNASLLKRMRRRSRVYLSLKEQQKQNSTLEPNPSQQSLSLQMPLVAIRHNLQKQVIPLVKAEKS